MRLRHILRRLLQLPVFTTVALLTLAIGIGANAAMFSVVDGVLLKPLPYPHTEELVVLDHARQLRSFLTGQGIRGRRWGKGRRSPATPAGRYSPADLGRRGLTADCPRSFY